MINTLIFDIGNVLAGFDWEDYLREKGYDREKLLRIANATVCSSLWSELDRRDSFSQELIDAFVANAPELREEILDFLNNSHLTVREYDYAPGLIMDLKQKGYRVYLLSNYSGRNFRYARETFKFLEYVDGGVISYEIGSVKPEKEIYEALIKKYGIDRRQALFIDDLEKNVLAAKHLGINAVQFTGIDKFRQLIDEAGMY